MIKEDPTIPVYFFCPRERRVLVGRFFRVSGLQNYIVTTEGDGTFFSSGGHYTFTNDYKVAKKQGVKFFKAEIKEQKNELIKTNKELFNLKWKRPIK